MGNPTLKQPDEPEKPARGVFGQLTIETIEAAMNLLPKPGPELADQPPRAIIVDRDPQFGIVRLTFEVFSFGKPQQWAWAGLRADPLFLELPVRSVRWLDDYWEPAARV